MSVETARPGTAWSALRAGGREDTGLEIPTLPAGAETDHGPVRLALGPEGEPRLLLPLAPHARKPDLPSAPALKITDTRYRLAGKTLRFLDMSCTTRELEPVFSDLADAILGRVREGMDGGAAAASALREFRALLIGARVREVPDHVICGLVGELFALERLIRIDTTAGALWRGPHGERHDFRGGSHALEVKTSMRASRDVVRISDLDQLAEPDGGTLHLLHLGLEPVVGGALSVGRLHADLVALGCDAQVLAVGLATVGCEDPLSPDWNRLAFIREREMLYDVRPGFPRIVPGDLAGGAAPQGVSEIEYDVDLAAATDFVVPAEAFDALAERMLECPPQG
ncbi:MAG: hypothetical protein ACJA1L_000082 [Paracoccaceae bacterium]